MKWSILFLLILLFTKSHVLAQSTKVDSLLSRLKTAKEDTNKINLLNQLSYSYRNRQPDSGLFYGEAAMALAKKLKWKEGMANAYNCIGNNYYSLSDAPKASDNYKQALTIYQQLNDKQQVAQSLNNIGTVYLYLLSDYLTALDYHEKARKLFEQLNYKPGLATNAGNLAIIYESLGDYPNALQKFQQAESIDEKINNQEGLATALGNMGIFYDDLSQYTKALEYCKKSLGIFQSIGNKVGVASNLTSIGNIYLDLHKFPDALQSYQQSLEMYKQMDDKSGMAKSLGNMGLVYANSSHDSEALKYYNQSYNINRDINNKSGMAGTLNNIADIYVNAPDSVIKKTGYRSEERYAKAIEKLKQSLQLSTETGELDLQQYALSSLSSVYEKQKNFALAYSTYKTYIVIRDSILNDEKQKEITQKEIEYQYSKREEVLKANQEKKDVLATAEIKRQTLIKNYTLGGVSMVGIFSFFMIVSYNRRKKTTFEKQVSEVEMKAMRSQMNPHFIFNCLHSINKYVIDNEKENASDYLIRFSKLMRLILENSCSQEVTLENDLAALELYMQLEAMRFQHKFQYQIQVATDIDIENTLIPPLLLQPFVENSIIHGIQNKEGGLIKISVSREDGMIRCVVEDNGIGRKKSIKIDSDKGKKRESLGIKITNERLQIINRLKKAKTAINIFDINETDRLMSGLRVELLLPFEQAY